MGEQKDKLLPEARTVYSDFLKKNKMFFTKERTQLLDFIFDRDYWLYSRVVRPAPDVTPAE